MPQTAADHFVKRLLTVKRLIAVRQLSGAIEAGQVFKHTPRFKIGILYAASFQFTAAVAVSVL